MSGKSVLNVIAEQLEQRHEDLALKCVTLGEEEGKFLADELLKDENSHVHGLHLWGVTFVAEGLKWIEELLAKSPHLKKLVASKGQIEEDMAMQLVRGAAQSTSIEAIVLSEMQMTKASSEALCDLLQRNHCLRELAVHDDKLQEGVAAVVETAVQQKRLTKLNVGWNDWKDDTTTKVCAALKSNTCLRNINLSGCSYVGEGADAVAEWLKNDRVVEKLSFSYTRGGRDEGLAKILNALQLNRTLKKVDLSSHVFGTQSRKALARVFEKNSTLQHLKVSNNYLKEPPHLKREPLLAIKISAHSDIHFSDMSGHCSSLKLL